MMLEEYKIALLQRMRISFPYGATFEQLVSLSIQMLGREHLHIAEACNGVLFDLQNEGLVYNEYQSHTNRKLWRVVINPEAGQRAGREA